MNFLWDRTDTEALERLLVTGNLSSYGETVAMWELEFAKWVGWGQGLSTSSGTAALTLALRAVGVGPGDLVVVPSLTFVATAQSIVAVGAEPVFVDVDPKTWCIDSTQLSGVLARYPIRAVVAVHFLGSRCDTESLLSDCRRVGVPLLEDAAQAFGSSLVQPGDSGRILAFSFDARKQLPLGQGGMILSDDANLLERARVFRHCGLTKGGDEFVAGEHGVNLLPSVLSAALGISVLQRVAAWNEFRRQVHERLNLGVASLAHVTTQSVDPATRPCPQRWPILVADVELRKRILGLARARHLPLAPLYPPVHTHPYFAGCRRADSLEETEKFAALNLCLDLDLSAGFEQVDAVLQLIKDAAAQRN